MITRAQMPRQLRNKGGIMTIGGGGYTGKPMGSRTGFGFIDKVKDRFRKLIPNELADIAVKAAPFVAPFNPGIAGLMRGIGRFDQRGSLSDAFKQGVATFGFGKLAGKIPGTQDYFGRGMEGARTLAGDVRTKAGNILDRRAPKKVFGADDALGGEMQTVGKKGIVETLKTGAKNVLQDLPKGLKGQLIAGGLSAGASLLASYFQGEFREQEPGETMDEYLAARRESVGKKMRVYMDNYFKTDPEYSALDDAGKDAFVARYNLQSGGRVDYQTGGITMANTLAENIRRNLANQTSINQRLQQARRNLEQQLPGRRAAQFQIEREANRIAAEELNRMTGGARGNPGGTSSGGLSSAPTISDIQAAIAANRNVNRIQTGPQPGELDPLGLPITSTIVGPLSETAPSLADIEATRKRIEAAQAAQAAMKPTYQEALMGESWETLSDNDQYRLAMEYPGETPPRRNPDFVPGFAKGGMPTGIMRTNKAGVIERDYRDKGGFVPVGIKEKADDVPAMLSKNEFVFTADAVRGAGGGSIEKGAQRMYNTMKNLEKRVV